MSQMFINCKSLTSIPDISKCDVGKSQNMMRLFENCHSLSFLPDLSKWNPANYNDYVNDKKHMLNECFSVIKAIFIAVSPNCANPTCFVWNLQFYIYCRDPPKFEKYIKNMYIILLFFEMLSIFSSHFFVYLWPKGGADMEILVILMLLNDYY